MAGAGRGRCQAQPACGKTRGDRRRDQALSAKLRRVPRSRGIGLEKKHAADLQLPAVQQQSDGALFWKITNGNTDRGMPSFSRLPELQRWQLVLYLRTLKPANEPQSKASAK